uniref:Huntingtin n=1 Tax=Strigamia maritima TaxID=126957 RepID=T1IW53_STRMM
MTLTSRMAALDKLFKAFEALKVFQPHKQLEEITVKKREQPLTSKEKILHCTTIADAISSPSLRLVQDFPKFLGIAMETFLLCCDDTDADVRMVADECLNRTIKNLMETNLGRLQVELYKEIKKNGAPRMLRAAVWRFADLCHLIRPQKCRPYLLLKSFLNNLKSTSSVFRRTAAISLTAVCQYSRKPNLFFSWLLGALLEMLIPVTPDKHIPTLLGALSCLRHIIPHLNEDQQENLTLKGSFGVRHRQPQVHYGLDQLIQVYELLLHYTQHPDHNVVTTSLEALQQLLLASPPLLVSSFLSPKGISRTRIYASDILELGQFQAGAEIGSLVSLAGDESGIEDDLCSTSDVNQPARESLTSLDSIGGDSESPQFSEVQPSEDDAMGLEEASCSSVADDDKSEYSNVKIGQLKDSVLLRAPVIGTLTRSPKLKHRMSKTPNNDPLNCENNDVFTWDPGTTNSPQTIDSAFRIGDIGSFTDQACPLMYCARLLCSSFLLTGTSGVIMPDKNVRVSVKALALGCLSASIGLEPKIFLFICLKIMKKVFFLEKTYDGQRIQDVLNFIHHSDPQMRGSAAYLIGSLLKASLRISLGRFDSLIKFAAADSSTVTFQHLIDGFLVILKNDSSVACRTALGALKLCLSSILSSEDGSQGMRIMNSLLQLTKHPYWLVRVELLELLATVSFKVIAYLEMSEGSRLSRYQENMFNQILFPLLGDDDSRVRQAAAAALVKMIPNIFYPADHPQHDPVIALAKEKTDAFLEPIVYDDSNHLRPVVNSLVRPFDTIRVKFVANTSTEMALSRVVDSLVKRLKSSTSKFTMFGCCHALCLLSDEYSVILYSYAWMCGLSGLHKQVKAQALRREFSLGNSFESDSFVGGIGIVNFILSLVTDTSVSMDLNSHQNALQLVGNLFAGNAFKTFQSHPVSENENVERWGIFGDKQIAVIADRLFTHLMRLLNMMSHAIEDQSPTPPPSKTTLPSLPSPSYISPIKRKNKSKDDAYPSTSAKSSNSKSGSGDKDEKSDKERTIIKPASASIGLGAFHGLPHYLRMFEVLKSSYSNYKLTLDMQGSERFSALLRTCLDVMSQLLEISTMTEVGEHAEEILSYLKSTITMEAMPTLRCVQQLLKALFGINLVNAWEGPPQTNTARKPGRATRLQSTVSSPGLYHHCFTAPYTQLMQSLSESMMRTSSTTEQNESSVNWVGWVRRQSEKKLQSLFRSIGKTGDKSSLASYIRLFEPLVIKALKQYTVTSDILLHSQVLNLLSQLVQLRVNYCLLDSDQIFIGFVLKQFEFFEEGQVCRSELLLPSIFHFLVLLSYERYHSKLIIGVPKIIQLCDGIMASGQPPTTHAIPCLIPIVEDLFLMRGVMNKADAGKELDTQREVIISMLMRLIQFEQVLELFILILQQSRKESEEKWKKLSRQIVDIVLPQLARQEILIDTQPALDTLHRLFETVAPSVFRPVDPLLKILFSPPHDLKTRSHLERWFGLVLAVLRVLIAQSKEEVVLGRLSELNLYVCVFSDTLPIHMHLGESQETALPPHPAFLNRSPEEIIARFLLQVIGMISNEIYRLCTTPTIEPTAYYFLSQQLAHLLLYMMHMFQSGIYRRVATVCMNLIKEECPPGYFSVHQMNTIFLRLAPLIPTVTLQWCNILILLNYDDQLFWAQVMKTSNRRTSYGGSSIIIENQISKIQSCNIEMVRMGGLILFCDYVCENLTDAEHMTWLIVNHVNEIVQLHSELPVQDLIGAIHRNSAASGLFIQAINTRCENLTKPSFLKHTLACLEAIHQSQSGALVMLIISKFLSTHHLVISRACDAMACHRLEMLLVEPEEEGARQFPAQDLEKHLGILQSSGLAKRHCQLETLLMKLRSHCFPHSPRVQMKSSQTSFSVDTITGIVMDKDRYINIVRTECFSSAACGAECAQLLSKLSNDDIIDIMSTKDFNLSVLDDCLSLGLNLTLEAYTKSSKSSSPSESPLPSPSPIGREAPLYRSTVTIILQHLSNLVELMPRPHQVFLTCDKTLLASKEVKYHNRLIDLLSDQSVWELIFQIVPAITRYLRTIDQIPWFSEIPTDSLRDIGRFCVLCIEALHWLVSKEVDPSPLYLDLGLDAIDAMLGDPNVSVIIGLRDYTTWVCSSVIGVYRLVTFFIKEDHLPRLPASGVERLLLDSDVPRVLETCDRAAELVLWVETTIRNDDSICSRFPDFIKRNLRQIIFGVARLPPVNSYCRTPPILWQMGWCPEVTTSPQMSVPPLPVEYLQDHEAFKQFIFRVNTLGWKSRQQFEETWMTLLGVLSATPINEGVELEEEVERVETSCLAVKCLTGLLLQTLLSPQQGNPNNSSYLHNKRDKPIAFLHTRCGKKLGVVLEIVHRRVREMVYKNDSTQNGLYEVNLERKLSPDKYGASQVSLEYLWTATGMLEESDSDVPSSGSYRVGSIEFHQRERRLIASGLDINSCLHFLLDLYSQWLAPLTITRLPLALLTEVTRSMVQLSDLFTERAQFEWMLDILMDLYRTHPPEDELLTSYLVLGISKAAAVVGMDLEFAERLKKILEGSLKSTHLPTRISTLHGFLYLLESGSSEETLLFLALSMDYISKQLENFNSCSNYSEEHVLITWTLLFYILENYCKDLQETDFAAKAVQVSIQIASSPEDSHPLSVYLLIMHGLERLLLAEVIGAKDAELLVKLGVDRFCQPNPIRSLVGLSLMLSCMYTSKENDKWSPSVASASVELLDSYNPQGTDAESLIVAMERVTVLFDRIKKGYPNEAEVVSRVLPIFLMDFFPPSDIMNKVIGEFISNQQPHPQMLASVVFNVFESVYLQSQQPLIQEWVMLSLSNFTQRSPISMAIWSLTCFFISASTNCWIRFLFSYIQRRMGKQELFDREMFCIAALDFCRQLMDKSQLELIHQVIAVVEQPYTPYADLISCLTLFQRNSYEPE